MPNKTIAIIGGGAAGLAAAVAAGKTLRSSHAADDVRIVVFEADERIGRTILATGNGRCNFSNASIDPEAYHNADFVAEALGALELSVLDAPAIAFRSCDNAVQAFFADLGLVWREEAEGRLYPYANKASSVLDVLRAAAASYGVEVRCEAPVATVEAPRNAGAPFALRMADGSFERAHQVIVACGGRVARRLLPEFSYIDARPVLGPLATDSKLTKQLDNIRVRCAVRLERAGREVASETGELLFRAYGVSGIAIFNLSRFAQPGDQLVIDLLPQIDEADVADFAARRRKALASLQQGMLDCESFLRGLVLPQVGRVLCKSIGLDEADECTKRIAPRLIAALKDMTLTVEGIGDERQCQVRRGGFAVEAFDPRSMAAYVQPGICVVGEALDVDAPCGGFNLHWAWASGMLAGIYAAERAMALEGGRA